MSLESIEAEYRDRTPTSLRLFEEGRSVNAGASKGAYYFPPYPLTLRRASGCELEDVDGHTYIDFSNHHTSQVIGHNHPAIVDAVQAQMANGIAMGAPTGIETKMARLMCDRVASLDRVRFVNSGTEATLHAIRLARCFSGKPTVAKFEGAYHGSHDAVEISVAPSLDTVGDSTDPVSVPTAGGMSPHAHEDTIVLPYHDEESVERILSRHRDELACVMLDPKAGIIPIRPDFMRRVREITQELGILLIFDEIVGFRQAKGGLQSKVGIKPDLTCFGKIIGGGFPVGAFGGRADLMDLTDNTEGPASVFQSGTHSGHAVAMAAGIATLETLTDEAYDHLDGLGQRLKTGLDQWCADKGIVAQTVATGSVFGIHFGIDQLENYRDFASADKALAHAMFLSLINQGYFLAGGLSMCAISLPTQESHIDGLISAIGTAYDDAVS
jgi:glutamate-1-semialdehyde 2,1-aminomutase